MTPSPPAPAVSPPGRPRADAPWGRRGSLYNFDTMRLLGAFLDAAALRLVQRVAEVADAQIAREGGGFSAGSLVSALAVARGLPAPLAGRVGVTLDVLAIAIDVADNVADRDEDAAAGRPLDTTYPGVPFAQLTAIPALLVGAVVASLPLSFPQPFHPGYGAQRLLEVLAVLVTGQGRPLEDPLRVEQISAEQGRLYALPWWLLEGPGGAEAARIEAWAVPFARTWQARRDWIEHRDEEMFQKRYEDARVAAKAAWLDGPPFGPGELFDVDRVVPERP